jgi:hypothetical protein
VGGTLAHAPATCIVQAGYCPTSGHQPCQGIIHLQAVARFDRPGGGLVTGRALGVGALGTSAPLGLPLPLPYTECTATAPSLSPEGTSISCESETPLELPQGSQLTVLCSAAANALIGNAVVEDVYCYAL